MAKWRPRNVGMMALGGVSTNGLAKGVSNKSWNQIMRRAFLAALLMSTAVDAYAVEIYMNPPGGSQRSGWPRKPHREASSTRGAGASESSALA
jgi:hypothetical protein